MAGLDAPRSPRVAPPGGRPRRAVSLLLALAAALTLLLGGEEARQAQAQELVVGAPRGTPLLEVEGGGSRVFFVGERALGFLTGYLYPDAVDGWLVTEVRLRIRPDDGTGTDPTATPPGLAICDARSNGEPDDGCLSLNPPPSGPVPDGATWWEVAYVVTSRLLLDPSADYTLHFTENGSTNPDNFHYLEASTSTAEAVSLGDGTFSDGMLELETGGAWVDSTDSKVPWARITGFPGDSRFLVSNSRQEQDFGAEPIRLASGFEFNDVYDAAQSFTTGTSTEGYLLTGVELSLSSDFGTSSPPTVTLHRVSATASPLTTLSRAGVIDYDVSYAFTPASPVRLNPSTTYWVVAEGGGDGLNWINTAATTTDIGSAGGWIIGDEGMIRAATSTGAFASVPDRNSFQMRVIGQFGSSNSSATGAPAVVAPNVFRLPAPLGVDLNGITDLNGSASIADTVTYNWQRFAANGTTLEQDNLAATSTYTLTAADVGKTIKVQVSFTDDAGFPEGPLTSDATPVITAAAGCAAPTYVGGARQLWKGKVGIERVGDKYGYFVDTNTVRRGSLDNDAFDTGTSARTFTVDEVYTADDSGTSLTIALEQRGLNGGELRSMALHVCDQELVYSKIPGYTNMGRSHEFKQTDFPAAELDWSPYAGRTLYLSRDQQRPEFAEASASSTTLVITFNEHLREDTALPNSAIRVKKTPSGGSEATQPLTGTPAISGKTVTVTLATAVSATDSDVKVAYTQPGSGNNLKDRFFQFLLGFEDQPVNNALAESVPPELAATNAAVLAADGLTLTLTYDEPLRASSVPAPSTFTVEATPPGGSETEFTLASSDAVTLGTTTVVLKLASPIANNDGSVKVSYARPATGAAIEDRNGNDAAAFTDRAVTNNSAIPRVSIAAVHTDATPGIAHAELRVTRPDQNTSSALVVNIEFTQAAAYLDSTTQTITIPAGDTSAKKEFPSYYTGNTSGDLTATVLEGDGYLQPVAPGNSATVDMKLPASGRTIMISHKRGSYHGR